MENGTDTLCLKERLSNLQTQICEIQSLEAIFSDEDHSIEVLTKESFERAQEVLELGFESDEKELRSIINEIKEISFRIKIPLKKKLFFFVEFMLPFRYPEVSSDIVIHADWCSRGKLSNVRSELNNFLGTIQLGVETCFEVIEYLRKNGTNLFKLEEQEAAVVVESKEFSPKTSSSFYRCYLWYHHIFSKHKKRNIKAWANDFGLTGIVIYGKPGLHVIEGVETDVRKYVSMLKGLNWKKIMVKAEEKPVHCNTSEKLKSLRVFEKFFEYSDEVRENAIEVMKSLLDKNGLHEHFETLIGFHCQDSQ